MQIQNEENKRQETSVYKENAEYKIQRQRQLLALILVSWRISSQQQNNISTTATTTISKSLKNKREDKQKRAKITQKEAMKGTND